ncbi:MULTISPECIES: histidine kinase [unclassified Spirosoma]|uniref:sensor histidine kinase n=1 Tax=unclassified Spirosoma TaxID=2621999 RepID=UPI0009695613|nr:MULTISPECIES: histidine kinase [unclassified Spirosoma]MBN8821681.1 histidine kinase [Spirosoma sp.]OJW80823.1 MAG: sensor protein lytS [Spirosoma sp. 48-14]
MWNLTFLRRFEPLFFIVIAIIYVVRRLFQEVHRLDQMIEQVQRLRLPASTIWHDVGDYNYILNNNIPLIAGVCFFLAGWYSFHQRAYPQLSLSIQDQKGWVSLAQALLLLFASAFSYHYLKQYVRFRHDTMHQIIGLKVYSLYRKRTVLADTIGLGIVVLAYELVFQFYSFLNQKIEQETQRYLQPLSYVFLGGAGLFLLSFALDGNLPPTLWQFHLQNTLTLLTLFIQVYFLHIYCFRYILPNIRNPSPSFPYHLLIYVLLGLAGPLLIWFASPSFHYFGNIVLFLLVSYVGSFSIAYLRETFSAEKTVLQTQISSKAAELASLRAQINPHFLFNALNSLYATALKENSEKTADGIQKLGDMMRFMLQENNRERIPLSKEIAYLQDYIQLQRMRLDESHNIEIRVTIQEPEREIYLAPMMLVPFVENAFKHGISLRYPSWIYTTLTLDATHLYFKVHNSLHPKHANDPEDEQSGLGLDNVRKRLELIYPGRHQLTIQQSEQDYFVGLTLVFW